MKPMEGSFSHSSASAFCRSTATSMVHSSKKPAILVPKPNANATAPKLSVSTAAQAKKKGKGSPSFSTSLTNHSGQGNLLKPNPVSKSEPIILGKAVSKSWLQCGKG